MRARTGQGTRRHAVGSEPPTTKASADPDENRERGLIRRDLVTYLQNSVREPKLQYQDLEVKLYSALRIKERVLALVDQVGRDAFIVSLDLDLPQDRQLSHWAASKR